MNDFLWPKLSHHLLVCLNSLITAIDNNINSLLRRPLVFDYLIYLNTRIGFPFLLNKQEYTDPIYRMKTGYQRLHKPLRDLFRD